MQRRRLLTTFGTVATTVLAGCSSDPTDTDPSNNTSDSQNKTPDSIYIPPHAEMMEMIGMDHAGRLMLSLLYARPHEFFVVTGTRANKIDVQDDDTMHLMAMVSDMETGAIAPQVEPTIRILKDGDEVVRNQPWPMLSQPMGYHFGDNIAASGEGTYRFEVTVNAAQSVLSDDVAEVFTKQTFTFETEFDPVSASELGEQSTGDEHRTTGALPPMSMDMMEVTQQPAYETLSLPTEPQYTDGLAVALGTSNDVAQLGFDPSAGEQVLIAAVQTEYNRYPLGFMGITATVTRNGEKLFRGELSSAVAGELGHYYGAPVPGLVAGDTIELEFDLPPQGARHKGYETAFFDMEPVEFTLPTPDTIHHD